VEDRRAVQAAEPLKESKDALQGELANKAVQGYVEGLLKNPTSILRCFRQGKPFSKELMPPKS